MRRRDCVSFGVTAGGAGGEERPFRVVEARCRPWRPSRAQRPGGLPGTARWGRAPTVPTPGRPWPRWRCSRRPSRSSSSQARRRGHARQTASWAISTVSWSAITSRLATRASSTAGGGGVDGEVGAGDALADRVAGLGRDDQPQEQVAGRLATLGRQRVDDLVGGPGDRPLDAAHGAVAGGGEHRSLAPLIGFGQGVGQQRQGAGLDRRRRAPTDRPAPAPAAARPWRRGLRSPHAAAVRPSPPTGRSRPAPGPPTREARSPHRDGRRAA